MAEIEIPMTSAKNYRGDLSGKEVVANFLEYPHVFLTGAFKAANLTADEVFYVRGETIKNGERMMQIEREDGRLGIFCPAALFIVYEP